MKKAYIKNLIYTLSAIVIMWTGWEIAYLAVKNEYVLPSFSSAMKEAGKLLISSSFWIAFSGTLLRTAEAFLISLALALVLAVLSEINGAARGILRPLVSAARVIPTMAVILILLIWTTPSAAPVIVTVLVAFPMLYATLLTAFDGVNNEYLDMCRAYKIGIKDRIFKMYIPLSLPYTLGEGGAQLSFALKVTISAEVLSKTYKSLGGMMSEAKMYVEMSELMALTVIAVVMGCVIELIFLAIKKLAVRWRA